MGVKEKAEVVKDVVVKGAIACNENRIDFKAGFDYGLLSEEQQKADREKDPKLLKLENDPTCGQRCGNKCGENYRDHKYFFMSGWIVITMGLLLFVAAFLPCCVEMCSCGGAASVQQAAEEIAAQAIAGPGCCSTTIVNVVSVVFSGLFTLMGTVMMAYPKGVEAAGSRGFDVLCGDSKDPDRSAANTDSEGSHPTHRRLMSPEEPSDQLWFGWMESKTLGIWSALGMMLLVTVVVGMYFRHRQTHADWQDAQQD